MEGINRVTLLGSLGQDPETRFTQSGQAVMTLRMATNESYFDDKSKERKSRVEWHTVVCWGKRGEALGKILHKGSNVLVEGRLQTRSWEGKDGGGKRYATEINALNIVLLPSREQGAERGRQDDSHSNGGGGYEDHGQAGGGDMDEIPFIVNECSGALFTLGRRII